LCLARRRLRLRRKRCSGHLLQPPPPPRRPGRRLAMSGARILVVDDEVQLRRALRRSLEGHGYEVREVGDGQSALATFPTFKPDVVLLDLMLPDMSGVAVCAELRRDHETPIIVLSV